MKRAAMRSTGLLVAGAVLLTACAGESADERNQRHLDAIATVTRSVYTLVGLEPPRELAIGEPCTDSFGNETDERSARYGSNDVDLGRPAEPALLDEILAGFGEPPDRSDRIGELSTGEEARIVDFALRIDDLDVSVSTRVTTTGKFGWSARTDC